MTCARNLVGVGPFAAVKHISAAVAADGVVTVIAGDHIGQVVADHVERRIAEQGDGGDARAEREDIAGIVRTALDAQIVVRDRQRLAGHRADQVDPVAVGCIRMRILDGVIGADKEVVLVEQLHILGHVEGLAIDLQELDIGLGGIDRTGHRVGDLRRAVRLDRDRVGGTGVVDDIGVDVVTAVEHIIARTGDEPVIAAIAVEDHAVVARQGRGIDLVGIRAAVQGDGARVEIGAGENAGNHEIVVPAERVDVDVVNVGEFGNDLGRVQTVGPRDDDLGRIGRQDFRKPAFQRHPRIEVRDRLDEEGFVAVGTVDHEGVGVRRRVGSRAAVNRVASVSDIPGDRVVAGTAIDGVVVRTAVELVVTAASEEHVVTGAAVQRVATCVPGRGHAVVADQDVVLVAAVERVGILEADEDRSLAVHSVEHIRSVGAAHKCEGAFREGELLDIREHLGLSVAIRTGVLDKGVGRIALEGVILDGSGKDRRVGARAAVKVVVAFAADEDVVTLAAVKDIDARAACDQVVTACAGDGLCNRRAVDDGIEDQAVIREQRVARIADIDRHRVGQGDAGQVDRPVCRACVERARISRHIRRRSIRIVDGRVDIGGVTPPGCHGAAEAAQRQARQIGVALDVDADLGERAVNLDVVDDHRADRRHDVIVGLFEAGDLDAGIRGAGEVVDRDVLDRRVAAILEQHDVAVAIARAIAIVGEIRTVDGDLADATFLAVDEHAMLGVAGERRIEDLQMADCNRAAGADTGCAALETDAVDRHRARTDVADQRDTRTARRIDDDAGCAARADERHSHVDLDALEIGTRSNQDDVTRIRRIDSCLDGLVAPGTDNAHGLGCSTVVEDQNFHLADLVDSVRAIDGEARDAAEADIEIAEANVVVGERSREQRGIDIAVGRTGAIVAEQHVVAAIAPQCVVTAEGADELRVVLAGQRLASIVALQRHRVVGQRRGGAAGHSDIVELRRIGEVDVAGDAVEVDRGSKDNAVRIDRHVGHGQPVDIVVVEDADRLVAIGAVDGHVIERNRSHGTGVAAELDAGIGAVDAVPVAGQLQAAEAGIAGILEEHDVAGAAAGSRSVAVVAEVGIGDLGVANRRAVDLDAVVGRPRDLGVLDLQRPERHITECLDAGARRIGDHEAVDQHGRARAEIS